jgi:hypothetical protein
VSLLGLDPILELDRDGCCRDLDSCFLFDGDNDRSSFLTLLPRTLIGVNSGHDGPGDVPRLPGPILGIVAIKHGYIKKQVMYDGGSPHPERWI